MLLRFLFLRCARTAFCAGALTVLSCAPVRADDIGVIAGHTWTRNEVVGVRLTQPTTDVVGTGRCFTIALPYTHPLGRRWSWAVQPTSYHLEYSGPAISSAEIPLSVRWSAPMRAWAPYVELGGGFHYGAGLSPGDERHAHLTPCVDAGVGLVQRTGAHRATLALRIVSAPQHGEWARRIALLAGMMQTVGLRGSDAPPTPEPQRTGSLFDGVHFGGPRLGVSAGYAHAAARSGSAGDILSAEGDSIAGGVVAETLSPETGPTLSLSFAFRSSTHVALCVQPTLATVKARHTYSVDHAPFALTETRAVVLRVPVQVRIDPLSGAVRPYVAVGPIFSGDVKRTSDAYEVRSSRSNPPNPFAEFDLSFREAITAAFDPTIGVSTRIAHRDVHAEVRSLATLLTDERRDTYTVLLGVDFTTSPTH